MSTLSIFDAARDSASASALIEGERSYSFAELAELTRPLVATLAQARPRALCLTPRAELKSLLWLYAAFASGTPVLTLHARASQSEREQLSALANAVELPAPDCDATTHEQDSRLDLPAAAAAASSALDPSRALVLIPTSGSTGKPRLVELSRGALLASARASASNLGWQPDDRWLLCLPLAHTGGLSIVVRCLLARSCVLLFEPGPAGALAQSPELGRVAEQATLISAVPTLLEGLLDAGFRGGPRLRAVLLGGSACSPALARRISAAGLPLLTSYGLTETASQVVTRRYAERYLPLPERAGCVSSGQPLPEVELRLDGGLIALRTPTRFTRYVGDAPAAEHSDAWLVTSDYGELGPDGELYVRGRADDTIVTAGENVDPLEVEAALLDLANVKAACVFGTPSARYGQVVSAAIVSDDPALESPEILSRLLADRLARHKQPRRVVRIESLPLTPSGKLDRRACAERWRDAFADQPPG